MPAYAPHASNAPSDMWSLSSGRLHSLHTAGACHPPTIEWPHTPHRQVPPPSLHLSLQSACYCQRQLNCLLQLSRHGKARVQGKQHLTQRSAGLLTQQQVPAEQPCPLHPRQQQMQMTMKTLSWSQPFCLKGCPGQGCRPLLPQQEPTNQEPQKLQVMAAVLLLLAWVLLPWSLQVGNELSRTLAAPAGHHVQQWTEGLHQGLC